MKRILLIITLTALLALPLVIAGCSRGGGTVLTESDVATIQGFGSRLDTHDTAIAQIKSTLNELDTATLEKLAALDADALAALLNLDLSTALSDISKAKTDITNLINRVTTLEEENSPGEGEESPASGEVTIVIDEAEPFVVASGDSGTTPYRFTVTIDNGTDEYKIVSYCISFICASTDGRAEIDGTPGLTVSGTSFGGGGVDFVATAIPDASDAWQLLFTPDTDFEVVVPYGKTVTLYHTIDLVTVDNELWEVTLTSVMVKEL